MFRGARLEGLFNKRRIFKYSPNLRLLLALDHSSPRSPGSFFVLLEFCFIFIFLVIYPIVSLSSEFSVFNAVFVVFVP